MEQAGEDEHYKSVYAEFGLAIYLAQCLEHAIVNALMFVDLIPHANKSAASSNEWRDLFDTYIGERFGFTLGKLLGELKRVMPVDSGLAQSLADALKLRNFLAHAFFRERAELFLSHSGREAMIQELVKAQESFQHVETLLAETIQPAQLELGFTPEALKAYRDSWARANGFEL